MILPKRISAYESQESSSLCSHSDILQELFNRIGPVDEVDLLYDRQDRSRGVAYVVYSNMRDAKRAIQEFDGANANNQPIKLTLVPTQPAAGRPARNPFETAIVRQSRSLFERVGHIARRGRGGGSDDGSNTRHSDVSKPPPENIDRYVPGQDSGNERRRSPRPRRGDGHSRGDARRPGQRRERNNNNNNSQGDGPAIVQGRPRKTAEELDAEMEDYWGKSANGAANNSTAAAVTEEDVDMVE
jgi:THO complex subunit 4